MRVFHIITSLETGGAQTVMVQLMQELKSLGIKQAVVSMKPNGEIVQQITDMGIPVNEVPFTPLTYLQARSRCEHLISSFQPDVIQSWLYHADFLTIFLRNQNKIPIVWGIHHSYETKSQNRLKLSTKIIIKINARFSKVVPRKIVCCSRSALESHSRIGYSRSKMVFIPNGVDVERFKPAPQSRAILRSELGLSVETPIIGYIARYHPQKDHATFFKAANLLLEKMDKTHFVLAGEHVNADNPEIQRYVLSSKQSSNFHLLGRRTDIPDVISALDVATLSSSGDEAFPLIIVEAMASGIPCVSTDVGDVKEMIGASGITVPTQNPEELSEGWLNILSKSPAEKIVLAKTARDQVLTNYTKEIMAKRYLEVYNSTTGYN